MFDFLRKKAHNFWIKWSNSGLKADLDSRISIQYRTIVNVAPVLFIEEKNQIDLLHACLICFFLVCIRSLSNLNKPNNLNWRDTQAGLMNWKNSKWKCNESLKLILS